MASIYVRKGTLDDLDDIMTIIADAKKVLAANGNPQWQSEYPQRSMLCDDIEQGNNYILIVDNKTVGTATMIAGDDPSYIHIDGSWNNEDPYATIHRFAISSQYKGMHLSSFYFSNLLTIAEIAGIHNVRFDTHRDNKAMQHLGNKFGFSERGTIKVDEPNDPYRTAYELNLEK